MDAAITALIHAATLAPSGDNTQPWRFDVDAAQRRLTLRVDGARDTSPMNSGDRMARIACGAAWENIRTAAAHAGASVEIDGIASDEIQLRLGARRSSISLPAVLAARATNRRRYSAAPLSTSELRTLETQTQEGTGVRAIWIADRARIATLARIIGHADALMFSQNAMRAAFLANVNFESASGEPVREGLSLASLELSRGQALALRIVRHMPDALFAFGPAGIFAAQTRDLVNSSSGLCLIAAPDRSPESDFYSGRLMQRIWLMLTARNFAAQPMMSPLVLSTVIEHGPEPLRTALCRAHAPRLLQEFADAIPELGRDLPAFLLRFGSAPAPSGRTARRAPLVRDVSNPVAVNA